LPSNNTVGAVKSGKVAVITANQTHDFTTILSDDEKTELPHK